MGKTIVFIEDEEDVRKAIKYLLEAEGYTCLEATNGPEGIAILSKTPSDLLLLDVMMPGMDGFEVCRIVKNQPELKLPVIFISARSDATDIARGFALGAEDYIIKPFDPQDLADRIGQVLQRSHKPVCR
jgi:DNA-binding response OmpR family regulator